MRRLLFLLCCIPLFAQANGTPQVLSSIKPLQLIAAAITDGISQPGVLLPPGANPHSYQLRPSQRKELADAAVTLWIGPGLEPYLAKLLHDQTSDIAAMELTGIKLAPFSNPDALHQHHDEEHGHDHEPEHDHQGDDPHIWLLPENALLIGQALSLHLQQLDPANQKSYQENFERFRAELQQFEQQSTALYPHLNQGQIFVFHDAWGYLARAFGLNISGYVTLSPEQQPGMRHLSELRQRFKAEAPLCIFIEPGFEPAYLTRLIDDLPIRTKQIDPLAASIPVSADGYLKFLQQTLGTIDHCLSTLK